MPPTACSGHAAATQQRKQLFRHTVTSLVRALLLPDWSAPNTWITPWHDGCDRTFEADLHELKQILWRLGEWFTDMDAIVGNHDLRIAKATQGQITIDMLIEDTPLQLGQYSYLYLWNPSNKEWIYVCHQFNYSKTSVTLAQDVWTVVTAPDGYSNETGERIPDYDPVVHGPNRQKCNIVVTHTHIAQAGFSPDGAWNCIGMGCMRDQRRTKYTQARATQFPKWNRQQVVGVEG